MASLAGKADPTLTSAAFRHGTSSMPYNLGPIYQQKAANFQKFAEVTKGFMDNLYADHINTENNMNLLAESIQSGGGLTSTYMIEQNNSLVNDFKDRLKKIPKGKKGELERQLLYQEMSDYAEDMNSSEQMYNGMVTNAANKRLLSSYNSDEKILFNLIMDDHINNTSNTQATYDPVSHQMVYSMQSANGETVTMSMSDINRGLSAHDPKYLNNIAGKFTNVVTMDKNYKDGQMTADDAIRFKNDLNKSITSWDEIRNVSKELFGTIKYTFEEVLNGQAKDINGNVDTTLIKTLYDELDAIGGIDMDGNNIINAADRDIYANPANAAILMDVLSKDKEKYKELMTGYLTETVVNDYYQQGVDQRPEQTGGGSGRTGKGGKSGKIDLGVSRLTNQRVYATEKDIGIKYKQIVNAKSGDSVEGWDGKRTYRYTYHVPKSGKGTWRYQLWDADREQFVTKGGFEGAAGGGGGVKSYSTNDVIGDLIPQTMLTSNIKSR